MLWAFATGHAGMTSVHGETADHAPAQPRPLRPHRRPAHRPPSRRWTGCARSTSSSTAPALQPTRTASSASFPASRRIVEVQGVEGNRLTTEPTLRRQRRQPGLAQRRTALPRPTRTRRVRSIKIDCSNRRRPARARCSRVSGAAAQVRRLKLRLRALPELNRFHRCARAAVRQALRANYQLSGYVLWHNVVPLDAQRSTRGPLSQHSQCRGAAS